jgi:hypothetical protein
MPQSVRTPHTPASHSGLPVGLKAGIESLSGIDLSDVRVHENSSKPARINALAYAQGSEIHLSPGQKRHLPHEAWHIVQQRQGRVRANFQAKGASINDDPVLEREADIMGERALSTPAGDSSHVRSPQPGPVTSAPIQRKVGFEFEDSEWRPWYLGYFSRMYPAERKKVLHHGTGYNLEADDTPGPRKSNLEFVTDAFEVSNNGGIALKTTLTAIRGVVHHLDGLTGTPGPQGTQDDDGPLPPYAFDATRLVSPAQHQFTGPDYGGGQHLYLSGGKAGGRFKMQATSGIGISDIPLVMKYFGSAQLAETPNEKSERDPARTAMIGSPDAAANSSILKVVGGAPAVAQAALLLIGGSPDLSPTEQAAFPANSPEMYGFLSALMLTLKMLQIPLQNVVKYRIPLMLRTNFANLFALLPLNQQAILTAHPQVLIDSVLSASNTHPLATMVKVPMDTGLTQDSPLIRTPRARAYGQDVVFPHSSLAAFTIGTWITGMTQGVDYLTPVELDAWLKTQGWWWWQRSKLVPLAESFGSIPRNDTAPVGGRGLAIFENRAIAPKSQLSVDEVCKLAWNQFRFYQQIEQSQSGVTPVGQYPDENP